jgi:hypothetical protein
MTNLPVGSVLYSMLDEAAFQSQVGAGERWVLANGASVAGQNTLYERVTRTSTIPNLLGVFVRGKNNGRSDGYQNPEGELALGQVSADRFKQHNHSGGTGPDAPDHTHGFGGYPFGASYGGDNQSQNVNTPPNGFHRQTDGASARHSHSIPQDGGSETAPKSVTMNPFIRIN